jgi:hypothetical protein
LQKEHLSQAHAPAIQLSNDLKAASAVKGDRSFEFGNIGFTAGIHYSEVKVERADVGSAYIGASNKEGTVPFGYGRLQKLNRWLGYGFVNYRASSASHTEKVYGDHFHAGDVVGVLLDCARGKVSFCMDWKELRRAHSVRSRDPFRLAQVTACQRIYTIVQGTNEYV